MNSHALDETVHSVAAQTIEGMAMMFLLDEQETPAQCFSRPMVARAEFSGPFTGKVLARTSEAVIAELAGNMLGMEPSDIQPEQLPDALMELANVFCGNMLPAIAGSEPIFHIGQPEIISETLADEEFGQTSGKVKLKVPQGVIELAICLNSDATSATTGNA